MSRMLTERPQPGSGGPSPLRLRFSVGVDDLVAGVSHYRRHSAAIRRQQRYAIITSVSNTFMLAVLIAVFTQHYTAVFAGAVAIAALQVLGIWYGERRGATLKFLAELYREAGTQTQCQELIVEPSSLVIRSTYSEARLAWAAVKRVDHIDRHGLIYLGELRVYVVPRDTVIEGDFDEVMAALQSKIATASDDIPAELGFLKPWTISVASTGEQPMFCSKCGYALVGLDKGRCPECGQEFDPRDALSHLRERKSQHFWQVARAIAALYAGIASVFAVKFAAITSENDTFAFLPRLAGTTLKDGMSIMSALVLLLLCHVIGFFIAHQACKGRPSPILVMLYAVVQLGLFVLLINTSLRLPGSPLPNVTASLALGSAAVICALPFLIILYGAIRISPTRDT